MMEDMAAKKLDITRFGTIMQDMYNLASMSDNWTWFLEADRFKDGTLTEQDLKRFEQDLDSLENEYGISDIGSIIEYDDQSIQTGRDDAVATFYGEFYCMFAPDPKQARAEMNEYFKDEEEMDLEF
ncbi:hypothetical protein [Ileibacterium valens]|uniref:hypothetical protein n=2 Tax=Erysipelotrichaceae TaxID=128827 RepID=UPI00272A2D8D|nr:hypothetical protein [Ileibacterium valens]